MCVRMHVCGCVGMHVCVHLCCRVLVVSMHGYLMSMGRWVIVYVHTYVCIVYVYVCMYMCVFAYSHSSVQFSPLQ